MNPIPLTIRALIVLESRIGLAQRKWRREWSSVSRRREIEHLETMRERVFDRIRADAAKADRVHLALESLRCGAATHCPRCHRYTYDCENPHEARPSCGSPASCGEWYCARCDIFFPERYDPATVEQWPQWRVDRLVELERSLSPPAGGAVNTPAPGFVPPVMLGPGGDFVYEWPPRDADTPCLGLQRVEREMEAARKCLGADEGVLDVVADGILRDIGAD